MRVDIVERFQDEVILNVYDEGNKTLYRVRAIGRIPVSCTVSGEEVAGPKADEAMNAAQDHLK